MKRSAILVSVLALVLVGTVANADPCGMVPPITVTVARPIERVGAQKTYVAYKSGIETMVLRPGFKGKVDEFGMLIPFPSAPAIRKVDENTFPHVAAAIDPPEVIARVIRRRWGRGRAYPSMAKSAAPAAAEDAASFESGLRFDEVRVLNREAVGMYDVVVLEAGSSFALKKWMDENKFRYPDGMEDVTQQYVEQKWVFVAVKTLVGNKGGVNPKPGMQKVDTAMPAGSEFTGNVQAMGFRFRSDKLVVPMRLSAFNEGKLRNIVYILTDKGQRIDRIPKEFVVRQISGKELYTNVTSPLPLRVIGGTIDELTPGQMQQVKVQRNSDPHLGRARDLFTDDMLALRKNRLANPYEEKEKDLLAIGEALNLRGTEIDKLHRQELDKDRDGDDKAALADLKKMTMTVVDGEFQREVVASDNLTFNNFRMNPKKNNRESYDARDMAPGQPRPQGKLYKASIDTILLERNAHKKKTRVLWGLLLGVAGLVVWRRRSLAQGVRMVAPVALAGAVLLTAGPADAKKWYPTNKLIERLGDKDTRDDARKTLKLRGTWAVDALVDNARNGKNIDTRGWSIVVLSDIGGSRVESALTSMHQDSTLPMLVRTWAAAARVNMVETPEQLAQVAFLSGQFPALQRPFTEKIEGFAAQAGGKDRAGKLIELSTKFPQFAAKLNQIIANLSSAELMHAMLSASDVNARRTAAAYLGGRVNVAGSTVPQDLLDALRFEPGAKKVPWDGGALFLPSVNWNQNQARELADSLVRWHLWGEIHGNRDVQRQCHNNLNNGYIPSRAGYRQQPANASVEQWLVAWGQVQGKEHIYWLLKQQGVEKQTRYRAVLDRLAGK